MGRKKTYDRDALIAKAVDMFRDRGFAGTSTQMLTDGLGVNRFSLYAEFGSKQGLFDAALERYDDEAVERNFGPLEAPGAGIAEIRALLEFFGSASKSPAWGRGCLLCNTAVELGPDDPSGAGFVQRYFERLSKAFHAALRNAHANGELAAPANTRDEASFFTASVLGLFVMLRAKAPPKIIKGAVRVAVGRLEALSGGAST
jgi:TetR/AcrR family transcriptional regulator, transcriptional repressor for nem operon